jgi:hypothetical protein
MTLGGAEAAGLTWLVKFIEPILSDKVRERLRKETPPETALRVSHALYESLVRLRTRSSQFVAMLKEMAETGPQSYLEPWRQNRYQSDLGQELERLEGALVNLEQCMHAVDPQLTIHAPEVVVEIDLARRNRALVKTRTYKTIRDWARGTRQEEIMQVLWAAQESHRRLDEAISSYRTFLASEFPYRESF